MYRSYKRNGIIEDVKIRYGAEPSIDGIWKDIISVDDENRRKQMIDDLVEVLSLDPERTGFFGATEFVDCGGFGRGFLLDDKNLYYSFFENLKFFNDQNIDGKATDGKIINLAIKKTIFDYSFGPKTHDFSDFRYSFPENNDEERRRELRQYLISVTGDGEHQSIENQKGQGTLLCTEDAAISHNLWLMAGKKSYFCFTNCDTLAGASAYEKDSHNFTIVEYDNKFRLYDVAMDNFCMLPTTCIDDMLSGKGLKVEASNSVKNPGAYVVADVKEKAE